MNIKRFISANLPAILTSMAVTGVVSTTVVAVRATPAAMIDIWDAEQDVVPEDERTPLKRSMDRVRVAWPHYVPAVLVGGVTIAAILSAQNINTKRQTAVVGLYSLTAKAYQEYREKVFEQIGKNKERAIRDDIAKDRIEANPPSSNQIFVTGRGKSLCYDSLSGRYFESDIEAVRKAVNDINHTCLNDMYAELNDFYRAIGLPITAHGAEIGFRYDHLLKIEFSAHLTEDDVPCVSLDYMTKPIYGYHKINR